MTIDYSALLYDPVYAELGVEATLTVEGTAGGAAITVIDDTRPKTITSGSSEVRSVGPGAFVRIPELAENGIEREDYLGAVLEFNGRAWEVRSYELRGSPNGEDVGEVRFFLKATDSISSGIAIGTAVGIGSAIGVGTDSASGAEFWTVFTETEPSGEGTAHVGAGTRKIYLSAQSGNDSNTGTQASPKATLNAGVSALRSGSPDWLLLKKGDTWTQETLTITGKAGQSAGAPMLIGAYGTGARPLLKRVNPTDPNESEHRISGNCSDLYIVGLDFYAHTRDPDSPDFLAASIAGENSMVVGVSVGGTGSTITMEDCKVRFYRHNIDVIGTYTTVRLRRCVILDAYDHRQPTGGNTEGMFFSFCTTPIMEECILDNNGQNYDLGHTPMILAHGGYYRQTGSLDGNGLPSGTSVCNGNWFSRNAVEGVQLRAGGTMVGNFYYLQGTGFDLGHWPADPEGGQIQTSITCTGNIVMRSIDPGAGRPGHGFNVDGCSGAGVVIDDNIVCHLHPDAYGTTESRAVEVVAGRGSSGLTISNLIIFGWDLGVFDTSGTILTNVDEDLAGVNTEGYSEPNRGEDGIGAYYESIGGSNSEAAFLTAIRAQSKDTWNNLLTARVVVNYIRAGFDLDPI